jgi:hypothetical protein
MRWTKPKIIAGKIIPGEDLEQAVVAHWLTLSGAMFFYCPNGFAYVGDRSKNSRGKFFGYLKKMKKLGMQKGVPDLHIITPPPKVLGAPGAIIEMKRLKKGKLSDEQIEWIEYYRSRGWAVATPEGADEAIEKLKIWGY